jgi:hypothetical protein
MLIATFSVVMTSGSMFFAYSLYGESPDGSIASYIGAVGLWSFITALVAFFVAAAYGLPIYRLLNKFKLANYFSLAVAGCLPGSVLYIYAPSPLNAASIVFGLLIAVMFYWCKMNEYFA